MTFVRNTPGELARSNPGERFQECPSSESQTRGIETPSAPRKRMLFPAAANPDDQVVTSLGYTEAPPSGCHLVAIHLRPWGTTGAGPEEAVGPEGAEAVGLGAGTPCDCARAPAGA